jgi:thioredoxin 1
MASAAILTVTDLSFQTEVLESNLPVLVDFWAEWCGPCKMMAPLLDKAAETHGDKITIAKVNVDENTQVPAQFGIRGIPTLIIFKAGKAVATKVGAINKLQLDEFIQSYI